MSETKAQGTTNPTPQAPDTAASKPTVVESAAGKAAAAHSVNHEDKKDVDASQGRLANVRRPTGDRYGGWPAMLKALGEHDEEKVKACKEDIDTLLVFAGLYSAVLSAFVIASHPSLQPDAKDEIVLLLRHMATQNYRIASGFLNSTDPLPPTPLFQAPQWAIRVNSLWFASLVFSLAAASIGMLVKQWLREFLAMENSSPQRRLRRRQYREPSLDLWRVFDIAAFLPVLLQVSLGLFFVGLCFFTAEIHRTIGIITLPLVCGWGFFLVATTLAPLFSPRCPFKTTFLKDILKSTRMSVYPFVKQVLGCIRKDLKSDIDIYMQEEHDFLDAGEDDAELLLAVDAIIPDNGLLSTILDAYRPEAGRDWSRDMDFLRRLVSHRATARKILDAIDLHALSTQDLDALTDMISDTVVAFPPVEGNDWAVNATILLLVRSRHLLHIAKDTRFACRYLDLEHFSEVLKVITAFYKDDSQSRVCCQTQVIDAIRKCSNISDHSDEINLRSIEEIGNCIASSLYHTPSPLRSANPTTRDLLQVFKHLGPDLIEPFQESLTQVVEWHTRYPSHDTKEIPQWLITVVMALLVGLTYTPPLSPLASGIQRALLSFFLAYPGLLAEGITKRISECPEVYIPLAFYFGRLSVPLKVSLNFYKDRVCDGQTSAHVSLVAVLRHGDLENRSNVVDDLQKFLLDVTRRPDIWQGDWGDGLKQVILSIVVLSRNDSGYHKKAVNVLSRMWAGSGKQHMSPPKFAELYCDMLGAEHAFFDAFFREVWKLNRDISAGEIQIHH